jgi:molybdopterin-guanine dinucleotide biosynthesis protein B
VWQRLSIRITSLNWISPAKIAGAVPAIICSPKRLGVIYDIEREWRIEELSERFADAADLILAEGYKESSYPKIAVGEKEGWEGLKEIRAVVSSQPLDIDLPVFKPEDAANIALFLESEIQKGGFLKKGDSR